MIERALPLTASLLAVGQLLQRLYHDILVCQQVSLVHFVILHTVGEERSQKMATLTERMHMTKGNLTYHIDQMQELGWVQREVSPTDKRVTLVTLTDEGRSVLDRVSQEFQARMGQLVQEVQPSEVIMIGAGLDLLLARSELLFTPPPAP